KKSFTESNHGEGISLYIYLLFCENLCTFRGCHKRVTIKHEMEQPYLQAELQERDLIDELLTDKPALKEIHLGGGTPAPFSREHLQGLYDLGFRRVSYGVQDYNETVQKAIHRIQPYEHVKQVTEWAREIGYESISHDLVFGLPFQHLDDVLNTIEQTNSLLPD